MTKFWVNGRRGESCHAVIDESGLLGEGFHQRTSELRNYYYPLEVREGVSYHKQAVDQNYCGPNQNKKDQNSTYNINI